MSPDPPADLHTVSPRFWRGAGLCRGHMAGKKNSTKIPTQLLPWLLSISYSVKVIKVSVWIKKKLEVCRLGPFCCSLAAETVRHDVLLLSPIFTRWLRETVASSPLAQSTARFLQKHRNIRG